MLKRLFVIALAALSAACSTLPRAELQAYRDAFQAAESAAEPMIADYAAAERAQRLARLQHNRERLYSAENPYFPSFEPSTDAAALSSIGLPPGAQAVDRAFRAIAAYNDTLVALAENRNVEEARGQMRQIISDVGGIVPGAQATTAVASAFSDVLTNVLEPLVAADNREQFRRIVLEGYDPMIALVDVLIRHSSDQYSTTISPYLTQLENDQGDRDALIVKINTWHRAFADYVVLLAGVKEQFGNLRGAILNPRSAPILARASAGAAELRGYADALRRSLGALRTAS
jgi:hypothetical protein